MFVDLSIILPELSLLSLMFTGYVPGALIDNAGRVKKCNVPQTTTLILIGPKGSGKSSIINRISRVLEGDKYGPDRAQVSCNLTFPPFLNR